MEQIKLWKNQPFESSCNIVMEYFPSENKKSDSAVIIFPGGGYVDLAPHEGKGYAEFLNKNGIDAFVVQYSVTPDRFPLPLMQARRAVRYVRHFAEKYNINPHKIGVMGSSAGGHLASLVSTYTDKIENENIDETDSESYLPDFQILCYPVIVTSNLEKCHTGSVYYLLGERLDLAKDVDPSLLASESTPPAFIWHTSDDGGVNVYNSLRYGEALRDHNVKFEMHIFPHGPHGMGLAVEDSYVSRWTTLLLEWMKENKFM